MKIDWTALGSVAAVSVIATVALVGLFTLGIVGLSRQEAAGSRGGSAPQGRVGAYACFGLCAVAIAYGIYLIVNR